MWNHSKEKSRNEYMIAGIIMLIMSIYVPLCMALPDNLTIEVQCGNAICEAGENSDNCASDCLLRPFDYYMDRPSGIRVEKGQQVILKLSIENRLNRTMPFEIRFDPAIEPFFRLEENFTSLEPLEHKDLSIVISAPDDAETRLLGGYMSLASQALDEKVFFELDVQDQKQALLDIEMETLNNLVYPGENITIEYELFFRRMAHDDTLLALDIFDPTNKTLIYHEEIPYIDAGGRTKHIVAFGGKMLEEGDYFITLSATINDSRILSTDRFTVRQKFWTPIKAALLMGFLGLSSVGIGMFYGYRAYARYKLEKMRYIFPDFTKIPKKDDASLWLGKIAETQKQAYYNPSDLTTHALIAGSTGSGKSVAASIFVEEALLKNTAVVIFDPTSQWTGFVKQCTDKNLLVRYKEFGLKDEDARSFRGLIYNVDTPDIKLELQRYMTPGEVTVFNLSALKPGQYDIAVQAIVDRVFEIKWEESPELKVMMVFDEVHRLLEKYGGSGGYKALEKGCREFRKWGIGMVMISQVSADFKEAVAGNILTEVQMNTKSMEDITKVAEKHGAVFSTKVTRQGIGVGMVQNPKYNNGKPWFVHFRPTYHNPHNLSEKDLNLYSMYSNRIDAIEMMLDNVKSELDNFDEITLELKLSKNKLKEGKFKMVEIYLRTISEKLGKKVSPDLASRFLKA